MKTLILKSFIQSLNANGIKFVLEKTSSAAITVQYQCNETLKTALCAVAKEYNAHYHIERDCECLYYTVPYGGWEATNFSFDSQYHTVTIKQYKRWLGVAPPILKCIDDDYCTDDCEV